MILVRNSIFCLFENRITIASPAIKLGMVIFIPAAYLSFKVIVAAHSHRIKKLICNLQDYKNMLFSFPGFLYNSHPTQNT
jgi:hypothetical protein